MRFLLDIITVICGLIVLIALASASPVSSFLGWMVSLLK